MRLDDLRHVDSADVYKGDLLAGTLQRTASGGVAFTYRPDYLAESQAGAVAFTLPRTADSVEAPAGAVPAFFAGLLPEGVRLQAVVAATRTSLDDHLSLLMAVGGDAVGDVAVVPAGSTPEDSKPPVSEADVASSDLTELFARAISLDPEQFERVALPGVQPKVSAAMVSAPVATTSGPAILKLNPASGFPRLVENEAFFLSMADACGLPVPDHRVVTDRLGARGLFVARFDRHVRPDGGIERLAQEDSCQILGRYPADKYRLRTPEVIAAVADVVDAGDGSRPLALLRLFQLVAFSYLIGNGDLHGKNVSVRCAADGTWEVTPAYDLVTTQPYASWNDPMALDFYGRANRLDRAHLLGAAERLGLPARALTQTLDTMCTQAVAWADRVDEIGFTDAQSERLRELILSRCRELEDPSTL